MTSEREMLLGDGPKPDKALGIKMRTRGMRIRRVLLVFSGVVLVLVGVVWLAGPKIAAGLLERELAVDLPTGLGRVVLDDVSLRWGGPQSAGTVQIEDPDGKMIAELRVETTAGLLGAYLSRDVGVVTLSGLIEVDEQQLAALTAGKASNSADATPASTLRHTKKRAAFDQIQLPSGWSGTLQVQNLDVRYMANTGGGDPELVEIQGLTLLASYNGTSAAQLAVECESPRIQARAEGAKLAGPDGMLRLEDAEIDINLAGRLPGWIIDSLLRATLGGETTSSDARSATSEDATFEAHFALRDGRLTLADGSRSATANWPLPAFLAGRIEGGARQIEWLERPATRLTIESLDIPLATGSAFGLPAGAINLTLETSLGSLSGAYDIDARPERVELRPGKLTITSEDLSQGLQAQGQIELVIGDRAPARIQIAGTSGPLLDGRGELIGTIPGGLETTITFVGVPVSLFEPWANRQGITLQDWVGGDAHSRLTLRTRRDSGPDGPLVTSVEFEGNAPFLEWWLVGEIDQNSVRLTGTDALRIQADNIGPLIRTLSAGQGFQIDGSGMLIANASEVSVPLVGGLPDLRGARGVFRVNVGGVTVTQGIGPDPVTLSSLDTEIVLENEDAVQLALDWRIRYGLDDVRMHGIITGSDVLTSRDGKGWPWTQMDLSGAQLNGNVRIDDIPAALANLMDPDLVPSIRQLVGSDLDLVIDFDGSDSPGLAGTVTGGAPEQFQINSAFAFNSELVGQIGPSRIGTVLSPELLQTVKNLYPSDSIESLELLEPASVLIEIEPVALQRLGSSANDRLSIGRVEGTLRTGSDVVIRRTGTDQSSEPITIAARNVEIRGWINTADTITGEFSVQGDVLDRSVEGSPHIASALSHLTLDGSAIRIDQATLESSNTAALDRLAQADGWLEGILGESVTLRASPEAGGLDELLNVSVTSEQLSGSGQLQLGPAGLSLTSPGSMHLELMPIVADRILGLHSADDSLRVIEPISVDLALNQFSIGAAPLVLDPRVFALNAVVKTPSIVLVDRSGERIEIGPTSMQVQKSDVQGAVDFEFISESITTATGTEQGPRATGRVNKLVDSSGALTLALATMTGSIQGGAPTALIDAAAQMEGLLIDLLGPSTQVEITTTELSRSAGAVSAIAKTDYAEANIAGTLSNETLLCPQEAMVTLSRVSPQLSARVLERMMPLLDGVEKTANDRPAIIRANNLVVPIDGDLSKLSGRLNVDLGTLQFATSGFVAKLLRSSNNRASGQLGRRVAPFEIVISDGVATYAKTTLPMGEFNIETRGTVDIAGGNMNLVLFLPLFALADEVVKGIAAAPVLDQLAMIPFRIKGPIDNPRVKLAPDLLPEAIVPNIIQDIAGEAGGEAGDIIKGAGRLLEGIGKGLGGKKKKKKND